MRTQQALAAALGVVVRSLGAGGPPTSAFTLLALLALGCSRAEAISIDGKLSDWDEVRTAAWSASSGRIRGFRIANDDRTLYFRVDFAHLPPDGKDLRVYVDTDADSSTGSNLACSAGAEVMLQLQWPAKICAVHVWSNALRKFYYINWAYSANAVAAGGDSVEFMVRLTNIPFIYLDAIMIRECRTMRFRAEAGADLTPWLTYQLAPEAMLVYNPKTWNVFRQGEQVALTLAVNGSLIEKSRNLVLEYAAIDCRGRPVQSGKRAVTRPIGTVVLKPARPGIYYVSYRLKEGERVLAHEESSFAVVPENDQVRADSPFGAMWSGVNASVAARIGMRCTRESFFWGLLEPAKGQFFWGGYDDSPMRLDRYGAVQTTVSCLLSTPPWAISLEFKGKNTGFAPPRAGDWANFVEATVTHYRNNVKYWQIGNEVLPGDGFWDGSEDEYLECLKTAYAAAKAAVPSCRVLIGSMPSGETGLLDRLLSKGAGRYFDILSYHVYSRCHQDTRRVAAEYNRVLRQYGLHVPVWVTEAGWSSHGRRGELRASGNLVQQLSCLLEAGIDRFFFYTMIHTVPHADPWDEGADLTLFNWNGTPKGTLVAYSEFIAKLWDARFVGRACVGDTVVYTFRKRNGKHVMVMWDEGFGSEVRLPGASGRTVEVTDVMGARVPTRNEEAGLRLDLEPDVPVYLQGADVERWAPKLDAVLQAHVTEAAPVVRETVLHGAAKSITLDGNLSDWTEDLAHVADTAGDVDNPAEDITEFWVTNDRNNLYFRADMAAGNGRASIFLDTDTSLETGNDGKRWTAKGTVGADYMAAYSAHDGGFGLFKYANEYRGSEPVAVLWATGFDHVRPSADGKSFEGRLELDRLGLKVGDRIYIMVRGQDFVGVSDCLPDKLGERLAYTLHL